MVKQEIRQPGKTASTGCYSAGIEMDGWLYISGQAAEDPGTGEMMGGTTAEQTRTALRHVGAVLAAAGAGFHDVVKCTCHLAEIRDFEEFNAAYAEFFSPPMPARTTVQSGLPEGIRVEIDAIARIPSKEEAP